MRWCIWWRHCAKSRKEFSIDVTLPAALVALGSTEPLIEMGVRDISLGVEAAGAQG
jgi:hypothetical protein